MEEKPYMTEEQAEQILMAAILGMFRDSKSKLSHAVLLIDARNKKEEE